MKKIVLILVMLLFTLISYSKGRIVDISSLEIQEGLNYVIGENKSYTGASIKKFENNGIEKKIKYKNGLVKVSKTYFENGQLWKEIRYVDNKQVTPTKWYCEGGHPLL